MYINIKYFTFFFKCTHFALMYHTERESMYLLVYKVDLRHVPTSMDVDLYAIVATMVVSFIELNNTTDDDTRPSNFQECTLEHLRVL